MQFAAKSIYIISDEIRLHTENSFHTNSKISKRTYRIITYFFFADSLFYNIVSKRAFQILYNRFHWFDTLKKKTTVTTAQHMISQFLRQGGTDEKI